MAGNGNDPIPFADHAFCQIEPGTFSDPGDNGRVTGHASFSTIAITRSGLPVPFLIFRGAAIKNAPVAGSLSRLFRLKWPRKTGPRAKMYPTLKTGYTNDEETQFFRQVQSYGGA